MGKPMTKDTDTTEHTTPKHNLRSKLSKTPQLKWQDRLLPTMNGLLVGLTIFFFLATFAQMVFIHWSILQTPPVEINQTNQREYLRTDSEGWRLSRH